MADGVAITAGSGTTILTDDTGAGGHAQVVKLAIATDGSGTLIPADAGGLAVQFGHGADVVGGGSQTGTADQSIMAAGGASVKNILCWVTLYNSSSTNTYATLKDGSTARAVFPLPAFGGAVFAFPRGIASTANTAWNIAAGTSVTTAYFYGGGYTTT
jgi:hypothetical protein